MTRGTAVGVQGERQKGKDAALRVLMVWESDLFSQFQVLLPVRQEVCDPPEGGAGHTELGELVLQQIMVLKAEVKSTNGILA